MRSVSFTHAIFEAFKVRQMCRFFLRVSYTVLRILVPTNPKQIGFVGCPDSTDNSRALFEELLESPRAHECRLICLVTNVLISRDILEREFPDVALGNVSTVSKNTLRGVWSFLRCRHVFITHGSYSFVHVGYHQTIVNLWHGMPIKNIGTYDNKTKSKICFMHYTIATSEYFADIMAKVFNLPMDRVLVTGLPRNEWLFVQEEGYFALKEGHAKLIVWLPTFRISCVTEIRRDSNENSDDTLNADTLAKLDEMLEGSNVMLVIKFHPMDIKNHQAWSFYRNIRIYTDLRFRAERLNLYKLLACSDALVTDFSSCAIDYLLLNKPIGIFALDTSSYVRGFIPGVLQKVLAVCQELRTFEEFGAFAKNLPPRRETKPEQEILHQMNLRSPSKAILRALGLTDIE